MGHALMENRNGSIVGAVTTRASGHAERLAALALIEPHADRPQPITLAADKGYDSVEFVMELREKAVTPHIAQNTSGRRSAIDGRTTRHPGYAVYQRIRKRVKEAFGWAKTVAGLRKMQHRGLPKVDWQFTLAMTAYDLVRLLIVRRTGGLSLFTCGNRTLHRLPIKNTPRTAAADHRASHRNHYAATSSLFFRNLPGLEP
jgi:IS5 family transposase